MAQQASAASYHLHTLSVMTAVGRNRQVWVTPSPVTAETRGTDETHCDRSLTSNCCNHLTPPHPTLHVCTKWGGVVLQSSSPLSWRVNMNGYSKRDPWEASLWNSPTDHSPITFFSPVHISPSETSLSDYVCFALWPREAIQNCTQLIMQPLFLERCLNNKKPYHI